MVLVVFQMLTRRIRLEGLLRLKDGSGAVSAARVQLLIVTLATAGNYLSQLPNASGKALPDINAMWVYGFGVSGGIYVVQKVWSAATRH